VEEGGGAVRLYLLSLGKSKIRSERKSLSLSEDEERKTGGYKHKEARLMPRKAMGRTQWESDGGKVKPFCKSLSLRNEVSGNPDLGECS